MNSALKFLSFIFAAFTMVFSIPVYAAYQYTYTSAPFEYIDNTFVRGHIFNISTDSFLKIVITSNNLLEEYADDPLANATYDFTVEGFNYRARPDGIYGDTRVSSDLLITNIAESGLPDRFYISYLESQSNPDTNQSNGIAFYADATFTQFIYGTTVDGIESRIFAVGSAEGGRWEMAQINSPVPEAPEYAMFLIGLGLIGFVSRKESLYKV